MHEVIILEFTHFQFVELDPSGVSEIISCKILFTFSSNSHLDVHFITSEVISFVTEIGGLVQMDFQYLWNLILNIVVAEIIK